MNASKVALNTIIAGAVAVTIAGAASNAHADKHKEQKEKCYGVVKAGKNMCGRADGKHSCAAQAEVDGDPQEWIYLPKGVCDKLVGGSLVSGEGGAHSCDKNGCDKDKNGCGKEKNGCDHG
ncbi:MAG: DUF2282 domain-containing protein [Alphaproteobacteria bacterium]|nr:DUF2282 domain-containing protein [Alphaproteobacteria bacterium]